MKKKIISIIMIFYVFSFSVVSSKALSIEDISATGNTNFKVFENNNENDMSLLSTADSVQDYIDSLETTQLNTNEIDVNNLLKTAAGSQGFTFSGFDTALINPQFSTLLDMTTVNSAYLTMLSQMTNMSEKDITGEGQGSGVSVVNLMQQQYGQNVIDQKGETAELPKGLSMTEMCKNINDTINAAYANSINSPEFQSIKSQVSQVSAFALANRGLPQRNLASADSLLASIGGSIMSKEDCINAWNSQNTINDKTVGNSNSGKGLLSAVAPASTQKFYSANEKKLKKVLPKGTSLIFAEDTKQGSVKLTCQNKKGKPKTYYIGVYDGKSYSSVSKAANSQTNKGSDSSGLNPDSPAGMGYVSYSKPVIKTKYAQKIK